MTYASSKVPTDFNGYTIVQMSDLHNKEFGDHQVRLLSETKKAKPDIIVITGDLIDGSRKNIPAAMDYVNGAVKIAPVYFVSGNNEYQSKVYSKLKKELKKAGVTILDNVEVTLKKGTSQISLLGMADPCFMLPEYLHGNSKYLSGDTLSSMVQADIDNFKILLSHRPELLDLYAGNNIDLVFAGHAHGGQIRLPLVGALYAPGQGLFPKYTTGMYKEHKTSMIVSRGLGESILPIRFLDSPELIVATLKSR
jgi:Predicted phosphohydrolases